MLVKIKNLYSRLSYSYLNKNYPNFKDLFFSNKPIIAYYGFLGDKNFGDEWVYESAINLFNDCCILPIQNYSTFSMMFFQKIFKNRIKGIVIGGGTLIGIRFYFEYDFKKLIDRNIPIFLHGTGVHPIKIENSFWNILLSKDVYGGLRGPFSIENSCNFSEKDKKIIGDAAFSMFENIDYSGKSRKVLINVGTHKNYNNYENVRNELKKFVTYLISNNYQPCFLPFHESDLVHGYNLKKHYPGLIILDVPKNYAEAISNFKEVEFAIGERLHFAVMALMSGVPMLSINYSHKHLDMLASINCLQLGVNPEDFNEEKVINSFLNRGNYERESIFEKIDDLNEVQKKSKQQFYDALMIH